VASARDAVLAAIEVARNPQAKMDPRLASTAPALASLFSFFDGLPPDIRAGLQMRLDVLYEAIDADMARLAPPEKTTKEAASG